MSTVNTEVHPYSTAHDGGSRYYTSYIRNYTAVGVMWGVFVICFAIINIVVFVQPQWIGNTGTSPGSGYFGLYEYCLHGPGGQNSFCRGKFDQFDTILSGEFTAASFFIGISALVVLICICCLVLFFCMRPSYVFLTCGCFLVLSGLCMLLGCVLYPAGWDNEVVRQVCGPSADKYQIGDCGVRWAFVLAIIGIFDAFILAILAFVLSSRYVPRKVEYVGQNGLHTKSDFNGYMPETESKPQMIIQPVMTVPADSATDYHSEYSHASAKRSRKGDFAL